MKKILLTMAVGLFSISTMATEAAPAYKMICTGSKTVGEANEDGEIWYSFISAFEQSESEVIEIPKTSVITEDTDEKYDANSVEFKTVLVSDFGDKINVHGNMSLSGKIDWMDLILPADLSTRISIEIEGSRMKHGSEVLFLELEDGRSPMVREAKIYGKKYQVAAEANTFFTLNNGECLGEDKCEGQQFAIGCSVVEVESNN